MLVQRKARRANSYTRSTNPPPAKPIRKRTAKGGRLSLSWLANRGSRIQREHTRTKRHRDLGREPLSRMLRRESTGKATSWVPDPIGESADDHGCHASEKGPFFPLLMHLCAFRAFSVFTTRIIFSFYTLQLLLCCKQLSY